MAPTHPRAAHRIRVLHLITDLDVGGAELMLARLVAASEDRLENRVVSLLPPGQVANDIGAAGVLTDSLGARSGADGAASLARLYRQLRSFQPQILQTWLYHADLAGIIAGKFARVPGIVWNIRCATLNRQDHPASIPMLQRVLARMSGLPSAIVSNSMAGIHAHERLGYRPRRWVLIPNGFDTSRYKPQPEARARLRHELGLGLETPLVGILARAHPMKDHDTFFAAAANVIRLHPQVHFLAAGRGIRESQAIAGVVARLGLRSNIHLLGERHDGPMILAGLDVAVSASYSEAFPNVVGEAMACGVVPIVTDTGDSAAIVGAAGRVVESRDPAALGRAVCDLIEMGLDARQALGRVARARIVEEYSMSRVAARYVELYGQLSEHASAMETAECVE